VSQSVQFRLHKRNQLFQRSLVPAAPGAKQLGDLLSGGWGRRHTDCSTPEILTRASAFYTTAEHHPKKNAQSWWVSYGLSALAHEPVETKSAGKLKQKPTPQSKTYAN
jgi:hypothetical protein